jgi:F-type H+-transporting ATPase subunit b
MLNPDIGLVFWTGISFLVVLFLLAKFAWKPILGAVKQREENIENALQAAEKAQAEMEKLNAKNEELLVQAREERDALISEAKAARDQMIADAKGTASSQAEKIIADAKATIEVEKRAAIAELKNTVGALSLEIAEKVVREKLSDDNNQKELIEKLVAEAHVN